MPETAATTAPTILSAHDPGARAPHGPDQSWRSRADEDRVARSTSMDGMFLPSPPIVHPPGGIGTPAGDIVDAVADQGVRLPGSISWGRAQPVGGRPA